MRATNLKSKNITKAIIERRLAFGAVLYLIMLNAIPIKIIKNIGRAKRIGKTNDRM